MNKAEHLEKHRAILLVAIIDYGGRATTEDLIQIGEEDSDILIYKQMFASWIGKLRWTLIDMCDEGLLAWPFGSVDNGDDHGRNQWIKIYRPKQKLGQQIWDITDKGKEYSATSKFTDMKIQSALKDIRQILSAGEQQQVQSNFFNPQDIRDARKRIIATIVCRRGQPEFRQKLLQIYNGRCMITGTDAEQALEAAHIIPYKGEETNHHSNGLLLRADLHTLFDLGLIAIDTTSMTVIVAPELLDSSYGELSGRKLRLPANFLDFPNVEALDLHRKDALL